MGYGRWVRLLVALVAVASLVLGVVGCGGGDGDDNGSSTRITGVVVDQQSQAPVPGATVSVSGKSARTDESGAFALSVSPGTVSMTVTAPGYQTGTFPAVADEGLTTNVGVLQLFNADNNPPPPPV